MSWPWSQLGLPGPSELPEIRRAYAQKLKTTHPEDDPEGFQRLHSAYQLASRMARQRKRKGAEPRTEDPLREAPSRKEPPRKEPPGEDFDFDRLLEDGEKDGRPRTEEGEQDFDFDRLLEEDETPPRPRPEEEQDFDFERLFAEGEAERAEARRRRGEERRRERVRWEEELSRRFDREQFRWQNTETILHTLEMMYNARAPLEEWKKFFASPLFQQNKGSLDLIFGLEDFVSTKPMPQEIKLALFLAYGFDKGVARPELRPLYQMLLPAWRESRWGTVHERKLAFWGIILGLVGPFVLVPLLDMGLLSALCVSLGLVWIAWVIRKVVKTGSMEARARGRTVKKKDELRAMLGFGLAVVLLLVVGWLRANPGLGWEDLLPTKDPREQTCRYIEQDFGVKVHSLYNRGGTYASEPYGNVFYVGDDSVNRRFLAGPDGERDKKNGKPGYTTNLPEMLLLWELKQFAKDHKMAPVNASDEGLERWETTGTFRITLPLYGGEEIIRDLGELLDGLREERWYKSLAQRCTLVLCSQEMKEGRVVLIRTQPGFTLYSAEQCLGIYQETFVHKCCAQIIRELELDRDFLREGEERYTLTNEGWARMKGHQCVKLFGLNEDGTVALEYYMCPEERNIYCVPGNFWETGGTEEQIGFYRPLHWKNADNDPLGIINLYYPWLMPVS